MFSPSCAIMEHSKKEEATLSTRSVEDVCPLESGGFDFVKTDFLLSDLSSKGFLLEQEFSHLLDILPEIMYTCRSIFYFWIFVH